MYLRSLELSNFRNFLARRFDFSPEVNVFYGPNASGKTNLLEAIYVLSNLRSFRTRLLRELIHWGQPQAYLRGTIQTGSMPNSAFREAEGETQPEEHPTRTPIKTLAIRIEPDALVASMNAKPCKSSKEYLQILPCTAFIPDDLSLIKGMPAARRYFLDSGTFQYYPAYWSLLTDYNRILRQKNTLLREFKGKMGKGAGGRGWSALALAEGHPCEVWNTQLQNVGSKIMLHRMSFVQQLRKFLKQIYVGWLGDKEVIDLRYKSSIRLAPEDFAELLDAGGTAPDQTYARIVSTYAQAIQDNVDREHRLGTAVVGPHRDDLEFDLWGKPLRAFGSQGQQRTAVLAVKLAEVYLYFERYAEYAILVLDDVTSELDADRSHKLFEYVQHGMQVFISTTSKPNLPVDSSLACAHFDLSNA